MHSYETKKIFQRELDEHGSVGRDQVKLEELEKIDGEMTYAIDIYDPELYESQCSLYVSELEAKEDYEELLTKCKGHKLYTVPCFWEMHGHTEVRAESLEEAVAKAESDEHPLPVGSYVTGSFKIDYAMVDEEVGRKYRIKYADTGYVMGKDGEPLVFDDMKEVWEEIGAYLSPDACDDDGITIEEVN